MCGIAGLIARGGLADEEALRFRAAADLMQHRGPDFTGDYRSDRLLLVHHRLSILDPDPRSNQPFRSADGRYVMVYNGEVYNFREVASRFGIDQRTTSDTEVIVESFAAAGVEAVHTWNGIFSCVIFDTLRDEIVWIRDRFGVKPLYRYEDDRFVAFSSEAKVLMNWLPRFSVNRHVLGQFVWFGNPTGADTVVSGIEKCPPGVVDRYHVEAGVWSQPRQFWSLFGLGKASVSDEEATDRTRDLLERAVKRQLVADVPVGVLLSGGIDSGGLVAFASKHYGRQLDTYSVEYDYNIGGKSELRDAALVARMYDTNHHEMRVTTDDVVSIFQDLVFQYDEPHADPADVPMYQLARACSADKRVVLQGDGGDELFGGYGRYAVMRRAALWRWASLAYPTIPHRRWRERVKRLHFVLSQKQQARMMAYYLTEEVPYKDPFAILSTEARVGLDEDTWYSDYESALSRMATTDRVQRLLLLDMHILLPHRYLEKVDKATMRCGLEARVPYLDNELAEWVLRLPPSQKLRGGRRKYILKRALEGSLPRSVLHGRKRGFGVPFRHWLRRDLYDFARDHFERHDIGLLDGAALTKLLDAHRSRQADHATLLWKALVLAQWCETYRAQIEWC